MSPQNRLVTSDEVAAVALLLASEEGRGINGQAINVDGVRSFFEQGSWTLREDSIIGHISFVICHLFI